MPSTSFAIKHQVTMFFLAWPRISSTGQEMPGNLCSTPKKRETNSRYIHRWLNVMYHFSSCVIMCHHAAWSGRGPPFSLAHGGPVRSGGVEEPPQDSVQIENEFVENLGAFWSCKTPCSGCFQNKAPNVLELYFWNYQNPSCFGGSPK